MSDLDHATSADQQRPAEAPCGMDGDVRLLANAPHLARSVVDQQVTCFGETQDGERLCAAEQAAAEVPQAEGSEVARHARALAEANWKKVATGLWIGIDAYAASQMRKHAMRHAHCALARSMARRIRDMLWLITRTNRTLFPGVDFAREWLAGLDAPAGFGDRLAEVLADPDCVRRVDAFLRLTSDLGQFAKAKLGLVDMPELSQLVLTEGVVAALFHEPDGSVYLVRAPHNLIQDGKRIVRAVADAYEKHDFVLGLGLFGSVANGYADGWSDMDFFILSDVWQPAAVRESILSGICPPGARRHTYYPDTDVLELSGVDIHIDYCVPDGDTWNGTAFWYSHLTTCQALHDPHGLIAKAKAQERRQLHGKAVEVLRADLIPLIERHFPRARAAAARDDTIAFSFHVAELVAAAFSLLAYANGSGIRSLKWAEPRLRQMQVVPRDAAARFRYVIAGASSASLAERWSECEALLREVHTMTAGRFPDLENCPTIAQRATN